MNNFSDNDPRKLKMLLQSRAAELFRICDLEDKGFINKKDIQRMRESLNLRPDQLEEVFESLDEDKNGYLTLDEFTAGFSKYIGVNLEDNDCSESANFERADLEADEEFRETMDSLGASHLIDSEPNIKSLWLRLRNDDHTLLRSFESFVANISQELKRSRTDFSILESALQNKSIDYDENIRRLYEEMEAQIKNERSKITQKESQKENEIKEKLGKDLLDKDKQLQDSLSKQIDMEQKLFRLNLLEYKQKQENERLIKEKAMLEEQLQEKNQSLQDSKSYINSLVQQTKEEKRNRFKETLKITENIAIERETLIKELELLKDINRKLRDERDELELKKKENKSVNGKKLTKKGSILSNYIGNQKSQDSDGGQFDPIKLIKADYYSEDEQESDIE
ncbi:ras and EF-hand domain-containing -like [Brachionus plicatilis]|uniref:Ras and EF-hand domain-containing-like n=1 Tax=Brachionus plicatilis TaxID=10195 RepID=A0A3M7SW43_BRAPC|nr:ras and EF-hand domain-containing -like [Brachionus plicatilis]